MREILLEEFSINSIETISDRARAEKKILNDQYFTPITIAKFMSTMFKQVKKKEIGT